VTSLTLGTGGKRLWLLRSRPDQIDHPSMRGGPSRCILSPPRRTRERRSRFCFGRQHGRPELGPSRTRVGAHVQRRSRGRYRLARRI